MDSILVACLGKVDKLRIADPCAGSASLDQGEALFFQDTGLQIQAIRSIAEVRSGNAVVMRADEWAQLLVSHTEARLLKTINVLADQPAWVIAELP
jgi:hypothetical protein